MKKLNHWTPEEKSLLEQIVSNFGGSPSRAYEKRPEWKAKLTAKHTEGAVYAKLHAMRRGIKRASAPTPPVKTETRLVVVNEGALHAVACPKCRHEFKVILS